jgi:inhibitor of cysteine peptidase
MPSLQSLSLVLLALLPILTAASCSSESPSIKATSSIRTAAIESVEVETDANSDAPQVNAIVRGYLPDGCTQVDEITQERNENVFTVTITTRQDPSLQCTPTLVPYEEVIPLDTLGIKSGMYTVIVNDTIAYFEIPQRVQ